MNEVELFYVDKVYNLQDDVDWTSFIEEEFEDDQPTIPIKEEKFMTFNGFGLKAVFREITLEDLQKVVQLEDQH